jgi:hypothetical protein
VSAHPRGFRRRLALTDRVLADEARTAYRTYDIQFGSWHRVSNDTR